jgi:CDP-diacylglycerol--glycerol-3-phosphate 3-phosphatidyltransferase
MHVAMWLLAVSSLVTLGQRVHAVRTSPGAMDPLETVQPQAESAQPPSDSTGEASGT